MPPVAVRRAAAAGAAVLALALPAAASGATWSAPQTLSHAHTFVDEPRLAFSRDGTALAGWAWMDGLGNDGLQGYSAASRSRAPGAGFGPGRTIAPGRRFADRPATIAGPLTYGTHGALLATSRPTADPSGTVARLAVRFGGAGGRFGRAREVRTAPYLQRPRLAVNGRGTAALAWSEDTGGLADQIYVALRPRHRNFRAPVLLGEGDVESLAVAVGPRGGVLVAWEGGGVIRARFKLWSQPWQRVNRIRSLHPAFHADLQPVVTATGRAVLAWSAQFADEGGDVGPIFFQAATRPAHGDHFRHAQTLDVLDFDQSRTEIDHVRGADGRSAVAWTGFDGAHRRVRVSVTDSGGRFMIPQEVSPERTDAVLWDLAAGPGGRLLAVWTEGEDQRSRVRAALAPATLLPFGPAEDVSPFAGAASGGGAFDPRTGVPTVVWSSRPPVSTAGGAVESFAQAASREG